MSGWLVYVPLIVALAAFGGMLVALYRAFFTEPRVREQAATDGDTARLQAEIAARDLQLKETNYWRDQVPILRDQIALLTAQVQDQIAMATAVLDRERAQWVAERRDMQAVIDDLRNRITLLEIQVRTP